ncbi:Abi-domain-containing protein [Ramaria rubella]|nr:Abi-domain-containing protein [Ramaria rubella]
MPDNTFFAPPPLLISGVIVSCYVGGIYAGRSARPSYGKTADLHNGERARQPAERWRDDDGVIRARLKAAFLSTCINCGIVYLCVVSQEHNDNRWIKAIKPSIALLGLDLYRLGFRSVLPNFLIPILYTGPLTAQWLSETLPFQRYWTYKESLKPIFSTWIGLRNFVVAPVTEEIVFRACLLAIDNLSRKTTSQMMFATPLWFGIAHLHHAYELYNKLGRTSSALNRVIITSLIQMTYTTLFGAYASFLLLRTGSVIPAITAHITANIMGLPQLGWELRQHPKHKLLICVAYLVGIVVFASMSKPWTTPTS